MRASRWIFWCATLLYAAAGCYLALRSGYLMGDALSRVSAARGVLFSRDRHLAAIGFVFTPLTALAQLPMVALSDLWPDLTRWGLTAVLMSAPFMAGAVVQVYKIGVDRGSPSWAVWSITALFALNPLVIFYGANGMSEAPFLLFLCWATRRLIRWLSTDDVHDLIGVGVALGLGYLARYDTLGAVVGVVVFVFAVSWRRSRVSRGLSGSRGLDPALLDAAIVVLPVAVAFVVWSATSWLVTGEVLQQFSSTYGNAAILQQSGGGATDPESALLFSVAEAVLMGPALPILLPLIAVLAWRRRDPEVLVPVAVLGAVLGFAADSYMSGLTFPFVRFYFCALPLMAVWALQLAPRRGALVTRRRGALGVDRQSDAPLRLGAVTGVGLVLVSIPVTAVLMLSSTLSTQQFALRSVIAPNPDDTSDRRAQEMRILASFSTERRLAEYLDSLDLPRGSVLMDTVYGFAVLTAAEVPDTYIVPSDEDFTTVLNRPAQNGVKYILAVPNSGRGESDAVNRRYPTLFETGSDIATLELEIPNDGEDQPTWRLYRVSA